jgi:hypothetical protein
MGSHTESEDHGWDINIPGHPPRADSPAYQDSRAMLHKIIATLPATDHVVRKGIQDHHGGGLWLKDAVGWFMVKNLAGIEWSAQFCADPVKVDWLRLNAARVYALYPSAVEQLGIETLLATPITDAAGVAAWTDSICNASVPLQAVPHSGVMPHGAGVHHYPTPITDIDTFRYDDFDLFVTDEAGHQVAVVPVAPRGSGDGRVQVLWANSGSQVHARHVTAQTTGRGLVLPPDDELAKLAFARQR